MDEIWKVIEGYDYPYEISNKGRVKLKNGKITSGYKQSAGYLEVNLRYNNKTIHHLIHRLVAKAFIPNPNKYSIINHKDENKHNNCVENLEWCTQKYNVNYGTGIERCAEAKFKPVKCIETGIMYKSLTEAQIQTNIYNISLAAKGIRKSAGGYHWEYVNK